MSAKDSATPSKQPSYRLRGSLLIANGLNIVFVSRQLGHANPSITPKSEVLRLTRNSGELLQRSIVESRRLAAATRRWARGRGAHAKLKAAAKLEQLEGRCEKIAGQISKRVAGEPIHDRLV